jgi:pyridoxamine 5'-phosphate oxidase
VLHPHTIEFWQGRRHRLHDRFLFTAETVGWRVERLAP